MTLFYLAFNIFQSYHANNHRNLDIVQQKYMIECEKDIPFYI